MFALENPQHERRERDGQRISSMYDHVHTEGQKDGEQNKREREQKCWRRHHTDQSVSGLVRVPDCKQQETEVQAAEKQAENLTLVSVWGRRLPRAEHVRLRFD